MEPKARTAPPVVLLVRHGESQGNLTRTFTDSPEVPITPLGQEQADRAAVFIRDHYPVRRLVTSPFRRARQTAEVISRVLGIPCEIDPEMREQSMGELAGQPYDAALRSPDFDPQRPWAWRPRRGESLVDVQTRVVPRLLAIVRSTPPGDATVVVSHAGVIQAVRAYLTGTWERLGPVPNAAIVEARIEPRPSASVVWTP